MINDAIMLQALQKEMTQLLRRSESTGTCGIDEADFLDSIKQYLGTKNRLDIEYLRKEFVTQFNKLPSQRRLLDKDSRIALFNSRADADVFYRKILRNVRVSKNDPIRRESYRESYIYNASGEEISSYRALYPQNYDISGSIKSLDKAFRHNPLSYDKIVDKANSMPTFSNDELQATRLVISRSMLKSAQLASEIRRSMRDGELEIDVNLNHAKIITEKQNTRSYLKKLEQQVADYTRENLVLSTKEYLSEAIIDMIFKGKPPKTVKPKVTRVTSSGKEIIEIVKPKATITKARRLRVGNAQMDSAQVVSYINRHISKYVRRYMGTEGALVWRTGRFANSVKATRSVMDTRMDSLYVYTTYMYYPYATFAKGGRMHTPQREPQKLINRSVRALLKESFQANWRLYVRDAAN